MVWIGVFWEYVTLFDTLVLRRFAGLYCSQSAYIYTQS
jgi:hypothetical protein